MADLVAKLAVDGSQWETGFKKAQSSVTSFASGFTSVLAPLGATLGAIWGASSSVSAFKESMESQRKLASVINATGSAAGLSTEEIAAFASEMQQLTNFEDDATTASAAVLAAFTNIKGDVFKDTLASAMDMTTVMGGELKDNVKLLGKALNDPIDGVKKLSKAGVQLTQDQENQIKAFQKSGNIIAAQEVLIGAIQGKFGGAAKAVADPFTQLTNVIGDVAENLGATMLPTINVVSSAISNWLGPIQSSGDAFLEFGVTVASYMSIAIDIISVAADMIGSSFTAAIAFAGDAFGGLWEMVGYGAATFDNVITEVMVMASHIGAFINIGIESFSLFAVQVGASIAHLFTEVAPAYLQWFGENWQNILVTVASNALTTFENIGTNIRSVWTSILNFFRTGQITFNWTPLTTGFVNTVKALPDIPPRAVGDLEKNLQASVGAAWESTQQSMDAQRADIGSKLSNTRESLMASFDTSTGTPSGSFEFDQKDHGDKQSKNTAALAGSKEAASTFMRGLGTGKDDTPKKIDQSNQYLKTIAGAVTKSSPMSQPDFAVANIGR